MNIAPPIADIYIHHAAPIKTMRLAESPSHLAGIGPDGLSLYVCRAVNCRDARIDDDVVCRAYARMADIDPARVQVLDEERPGWGKLVGFRIYRLEVTL